MLCAKHAAEWARWVDSIGPGSRLADQLAAGSLTLVAIGTPRPADIVRPGARALDLVRQQTQLIADACAAGRGCTPKETPR